MTSIILAFLLPWGFAHVHAQSAFSAAGGDGVTELGSVSFTYGQVSQAWTGSLYFQVNQGVQQPAEFVSTEVLEVDRASFTCRVFPNPVLQDLFLVIDPGDGAERQGDLKMSLMDAVGKMVLQEDLGSVPCQVRIPMDGRVPGIYTLQLLDTETNNHTNFRIIKI